MASDFGDLRSLIHNPVDDYSWQKAVWSLIKMAYEESPSVYLSRWLPYLLEAPGFLWEKNLAHFRSTEHLDQAAIIAPFAHFGLSFQSKPLASLLMSSGLHKVTQLDLWLVNGEEDQWAEFIQGCGPLNHLMVGACDLTPKDIEALVLTCPLPDLVFLNLQTNDMDATDMEIVASSPYLTALERLSFFENQMNATSIPYLAQASWLPTLSYLGFGSNELAQDGVGALGDIEALDTLAELDLERNNVRDSGCEILAHHTNLTGLTTLDLAMNSIGDEGIRALANSTSLTSLVHLSMDDNHIGDEGIKILVNSPLITQLRSFSIMQDSISIDTAMMIQAAVEAQPHEVTLSLDYHTPEWFSALEYDHSTEVYLSDREMSETDMALLALWPGLSTHESYHLNGSQITDRGLAAFLDSPKLNEVKYLDLSENDLTTKGLKSLTSATCLHNIESLALLDSGCNDEVIEHFIKSSQWPELECLDLSYNSNITSKGVFALAGASCWPKLTTLEFSSEKVGLGSLIALLTSPNCINVERFEFESIPPEIGEMHCYPYEGPRALKFLEFEAAHFGDAHIALLASLPHLGGLNTLSLHSNKMTAVGAKMLAESHVFENLKNLTLSGNPISNEGFDALVCSPYLKNIRELFCVRIKLDDAGVERMTRASFPSITTLAMGGNNLTDKGVVQLLSCLPDTMDWLSLWGSPMGDEGVLLVTQKPWKALKRLDLGRTCMTDDGLASLLRVPWLGGLDYLGLDNNRLTNKSAQAIAQCEALSTIREVSVRKTDMDEEGLAMMKASAYLTEYTKHWIR